MQEFYLIAHKVYSSMKMNASNSYNDCNIPNRVLLAVITCNYNRNNFSPTEGSLTNLASISNEQLEWCFLCGRKRREFLM